MTIALLLIAFVLVLPTPRLMLSRCPEFGADSGVGRYRGGARGGEASVVKRIEAAGWYVWLQRKLRRGSAKAKPQELLDAAAALDLLASSFRAGLPPATAVRVASEGCAPSLSNAFARCSSRLALGAEQPWAGLSDFPALVELPTVAERSAHSGTALMKSIDEIAEANRNRAGDAGEAVAERAGVLIAAPLALCFLPAFVVLGLIPTIAGLADTMLDGLVP